MQPFENDRLMAYVDGELDGPECAAFERQLLDAPSLRQQVSALREMNAVLGVAFNQALHGEMPPLRALAERRPAAWWQPLGGWLVAGDSLRWQPLAVAALLLVMISGGGGYLLSDSATPAAALAPAAQMATLNRTLETQLSGTTVAWRDERSGVEGQITPVRTFKTEQGKFCREFVERELIAQQWREQHAVACREGEGDWQVRARYYL